MKLRAKRRFTRTLAALLGCFVGGAALAANEGEAVVYEIGGSQYQGYYASPSEGAPLVLLAHDWNGLTDYEKKRANSLADQGYAVFAADLFGQGVRPTKVKDKRQHTGALYENRQKLRRLMGGALEQAEAMGADTAHAVAMGYCFGGAAVLEMARSGADLAGFATFHGGLGTPDGQDYSQAQGAYLILHGTADSIVSMDDFASLAERLEANDLDHLMVTFGGAPHAFTVFGEDAYRRQADERSWSLFLSFLAEQLGGDSGPHS